MFYLNRGCFNKKYSPADRRVECSASQVQMKRKALKVIEEEVKSEEASPKEETPVLPEPTTIVNDAADAPDIADTTDTTSKRRKKKTRRPVFSDTIPAIPVASFHRLAREMAENCRSDLRWEADALQALQVAAEAFMVEKFKKAGEMSDLFDRKTIGVELMRA